MALNMGEIVTVTKHDHEGRILEFVKTPIPLGTANELKEAALAESERKRDKAVLRDAAALIENAKALRLAAKKVTETPLQLDAPPAPPIKSVPQAALPAPAVDRRSPPRLAPPSAATPNALDAKKARYQTELLKVWAERDGGQLGKSCITQMLEPHKNCPAGSRAEVNRDQLDGVVRSVLDQLCQQNFPPVKMSESRGAFLKAFWNGADAAVADFNAVHARVTEAQGIKR